MTEAAPLVLSLFPGIGLLDMAFELEGFCVVRGPDLLWGGDIRTFHPPAGKFDGVIGGPPCQLFSGLANFSHRWNRKPENLIPEYERVVELVQPEWFVMENGPNAPVPAVAGFVVYDYLLNNRWLNQEQDRLRRFSFGTCAGYSLVIEVCALMLVDHCRTVTASHAGSRRGMKGPIEKLTVEEAMRRQGIASGLFGDRSPYRRDAQLKMVAEGVPLPMGRAVAKAVKRAMGYQLEERAS